ncbi:GMC family oxidoreductase [Glaciihabitans tibetensis]|nr:GMC family oxidoreductase N-terminal domain-containing protein [Glaciihabitans tibetensis]
MTHSPLADPRPHVIVVGTGAAGLMVADRLADVARVTVIEAGADAGSPPPRWLLDDLAFGPGVDWGDSDAATGLSLPRGKVTGGSTSINAAAALRGQPWCFDEWNLPGWAWEDIAPSFEAIENDAQFGSEPGHGSEGPIPITRLSFSPIDETFVEWARARGHAWVDDQNAPGALGVGHWPTNMVDNGRRWGTHAAVLPGLRARATVRTSTEVTRLLLIDGECVGVEVNGPNGLEALHADHVVLSAGSFNSPAILLRSGIGPANTLAEANVPMQVEIPGVGRNLQDHPWAVLSVRATDPKAPGLRPVNGALLRYEIEQDDHLEVHLYPHQALPYVPGSDEAEVLVGIGLMRATSRGAVTLSSDGDLEVRMNHLSDEQDKRAWRAVLADATQYVDDMVAAGVFEPPVSPWWTSDDLDGAIRDHQDSYGHAVGTCQMGTDDNPSAVVDPSLAVRGVARLSVIDASVIPISPRANTMLASMAVGWRGGEMLATQLTTTENRSTTGRPTHATS